MVYRSIAIPMLILVLGALLSGCGGRKTDTGDGSHPGGESALTVFAASSLTEAFSEVKTAFEQAHPGTSITYNFGGSQQIATQLIQGADADVFASADQAQMQSAQAAGIVASDPVVFARNRLAIVVPRDNPAGVTEPADLAHEGVKLVVAAPEVPAGTYTREALDRLSAAPGYGAGFRQDVEANIVSEEGNVRQVVAKVRLGEADAGIVYTTDVTRDAADDLQVIEIPDVFNVVADYPVAAIVEGDTGLAQEFIGFLLSDAGQAILEAHGFVGAP